MAAYSQVLLKTQRETPSVRLNGDLRRHRRVPLDIGGRFMRANREEFVCRLKDISVGGACVSTVQSVETGEKIIAYFDHIGGLEGLVTRQLPDGFAIQFKVSEHKREKLAAQIMWLLNRDDFPEEAGRQHERHGTSGRKTTLRFDDGMLIDVDLLDLSASGASVATMARPAIGEEVSIAKIRAVVRRHHADGIGVQFFMVQDEATLAANFP
ncbi:MAG: PilZ domain-containing protein [Hyphomicrobium sp.]|nr:PilZ domain-containing protein [Hyphomicrobium sp.]